MNILFISDIHSNYEALKIMENIINKADKVFCLGDILGYHCQVNEVIDYIREKKIECIVGNHDRYIISDSEYGNKNINEGVKFGIEFAKKEIREDNLKWLKSLPTSLSYTLNGISIFCCHGSPWDVTNEYLYPNLNDRINKLKEFNYNIIAFGHTHRSYTKIFEKKKIAINPGSVGQARDKECKVCGVLININTFNIDYIELKYNYKKVLEIAKKNNAGDFIYKHFNKGVEDDIF